MACLLGINAETRRVQLISVLRMKIWLHYLSDPGYQIGIGQELCVSQVAVSRKMTVVIDSIVAQSSYEIRFLSTNSCDKALV